MSSLNIWFGIITALEGRMSLEAIGAKVGCSDSSLCRYKTGLGEPKWTVANKIIALHAIHFTNETPIPAESLSKAK